MDALLCQPIGAGRLPEARHRFFPKLDLWLSTRAAERDLAIRDLIERHASPRWRAYLLRCHVLGFLGRFGASFDPVSAIFQFPTAKCGLLCLPGTGTGAIRAALLKLEPQGFRHRVQRQNGDNVLHPRMARVADLRLFPLICPLQDPFERCVQAYLRDVVNPSRAGTGPPPVIRHHIRQAHKVLGLRGGISRGLSFAEFVAYLTQLPQWMLPPQWRPQSHALRGLEAYAAVVPAADMARFLENQGVLPPGQTWRVARPGREGTQTPAADLADMPSGAMRLQGAAKRHDLFDRAAMQALAAFYHEDIALMARIGAGQRDAA